MRELDIERSRNLIYYSSKLKVVLQLMFDCAFFVIQIEFKSNSNQTIKTYAYFIYSICSRIRFVKSQRRQ